MAQCEAIFVSPGPDGQGIETACAAEATHVIYGDTRMCAACAHASLEDASPEEQATLQEIPPEDQERA